MSRAVPDPGPIRVELPKLPERPPPAHRPQWLAQRYAAQPTSDADPAAASRDANTFIADIYAASPRYIGSNAAANDPTRGSLDDFRIYDATGLDFDNYLARSLWLIGTINPAPP